MALQPNWLDSKYDTAFEQATAEQALELLAKDTRIVEAVEGALADRDEKIAKAKREKRNWVGPTRTQTVRKAIVEVLEAAS